ncbi:MAG TPA: hypothetical protein VMT58_02460 [Candidatus Binataceae bacterium]|nr:hypothetical protein [Candidatus Binataceae bacterium]
MLRVKVLAPAFAFLVATSLDAHAVSLTLSGNGAAVRVEDAQAVYASDNNGVASLITGAGMRLHDGSLVLQAGVPSMMPDGRVIFGAETQPAGSKSKPRWNIYIGNADAVPSHRVIPSLRKGAAAAGCAPVFVGDPYPVADNDGGIAFMAAQEHRGDALFYYSHGSLKCLATAGARTNQGHRIEVLSFGSPQMGADGQVVFNAFLSSRDDGPADAHRQALLIASPGHGIDELAVEGEFGPNHTRYERPFGLPAAAVSARGTIAAFTARTPAGAALFVYDGKDMVRVLPTGTLSPIGPVSYLSPGRPGLMPDGTAAVLAACAKMPAIFRLSHQRLDLRIQRGYMTPLGAELESLGDPILTASGSMFIGATDSDGRERLYVLSKNDAFFEIGVPALLFQISYSSRSRSHSIFTGTLTVNQHGDFGYLGGE